MRLIATQSPEFANGALSILSRRKFTTVQIITLSIDFWLNDNFLFLLNHFLPPQSPYFLLIHSVSLT